MTPIEKAEELINKFKKFNLSRYLAGECALIAVDEIINSRPVITDSQVEYNEYWQEVRKEIELL
jgi:hypothetical protein